MPDVTTMQIKSRPKFQTILFVDKTAELSAEDRSTLEGFGYTVVILNGDPRSVLHVQCISQGD